jgi:hypothetical protein
MNRKRNTLGLLLGVFVAAFVPASALAGFAHNIPVYINSSGATNFAEGSFQDARFSADSTQYIRCYTRALGPTSQQGVCYARNAASEFLMCVTSEAAALAVIQSMSGDSYIQFWVDDGASTCRNVTSHNGSSFVD